MVIVIKVVVLMMMIMNKKTKERQKMKEEEEEKEEVKEEEEVEWEWLMKQNALYTVPVFNLIRVIQFQHSALSAKRKCASFEGKYSITFMKKNN